MYLVNFAYYLALEHANLLPETVLFVTPDLPALALTYPRPGTLCNVR